MIIGVSALRAPHAFGLMIADLQGGWSSERRRHEAGAMSRCKPGTGKAVVWFLSEFGLDE
jgi:hypothetical protein